MAIVNVNSISGINSITAQSTSLNFYTAAGNNLPISAGTLNVGTGASVSSPAINVLTLGTNNSERVRINSSGNIGVGTNGPVATVDVVTNSTAEGLRVRGRSTDNIGSIYFYNNSASTSQGYIQARTAELRIDTDSSNPLTFYAGGSERVRVSAGGSFGIGESSPDLALHVSGTPGYPASSGNIPTGFISLRRKSAGGTHGLHMGVAGVAPFGSWLQAQDANSLGTNYPLLLNPNGGSVGVGTINPSSTLSVQGTIESLCDTNSPISANEGGQLILRAPAQAGGTKYRFSIDNYYGTAGTSGNVGHFRFIRENDGDASSGSVLATLDESGRLRLPSQPSWNLRPNSNGTVTTSSSSNFVGWSADTNGSSSKLCHIQGVTLTGSSSGILGATSSGRINFPVAGKYKVWCTIRCENMPGTGNIYLYINGSLLARQHVEGWGSTYGMPYYHGFHSHVINVAANDYLEWQIVTPSGAQISGYNDTVNWCGGYFIG